MITLALDTSNKAMSVAVVQDGELLAETTLNKMRTHSEQLLPTIDRLVELSGLQPDDIDRVAVAQGPGSYTGLRIGVTTAKTLAYTLNIELVGVSSLATLAANVRSSDAIIVPLMDARRGNVFAGMYQWCKGELKSVALDKHVSLDHLLEEVQALGQPAIFVGATEKMRLTISEALGGGARFTDALNSLPNAGRIAELARHMQPVDIDSFVPQYLRLTEAEVNWMHAHPGVKQTNYVEKV